MIGQIRCSLISVSAPAVQHILKADVSQLKWSGNLRNLINELKELLWERDRAYVARYTHGPKVDVSIKAERVNDDGVREEVRYLKIPLVPTRVTTLLSSSRDKVYTALNTYCITQKVVLGWRKKCIYFLPYSMTNEMLKAIEEANDYVRQARRIMDDYLSSPYFNKLNEILLSYGLIKHRLGLQSTDIGTVTYSLTPIVFDPEVLKDYVEPKLMEDVRRIIEQRKRSIVEEAVKVLRLRISEVAEQILKQKVTEMDVEQALEKLANLAEDVGLSAIKHSVIPKLRDEFTKAIEGGYVIDVKAVNSRVAAALKEVVVLAQAPAGA